MNALAVIFIIAGAVGLALLLWSYTKRGKEWLERL